MNLEETRAACPQRTVLLVKLLPVCSGMNMEYVTIDAVYSEVLTASLKKARTVQVEEAVP
jgi:hypothetical protein